MKYKAFKYLPIFFLLFCQELYAQELIERFYDWSLFRGKRINDEICYLAATPMKTDGNYDKRGEPFFLVSLVKDDADEISVSSGFIYKSSSNVEVSFGSKKFYLFPYDATAWSNKKSDDIDILKEMQKSSDLVVSGVTRDGKMAIDSYSLIGFVKAYRKMQEVCRVQ
jgi:hypothetical protein